MKLKQNFLESLSSTADKEHQSELISKFGDFSIEENLPRDFFKKSKGGPDSEIEGLDISWINSFDLNEMIKDAENMNSNPDYIKSIKNLASLDNEPLESEDAPTSHRDELETVDLGSLLKVVGGEVLDMEEFNTYFRMNPLHQKEILTTVKQIVSDITLRKAKCKIKLETIRDINVDSLLFEVTVKDRRFYIDEKNDNLTQVSIDLSDIGPIVPAAPNGYLLMGTKPPVNLKKLDPLSPLLIRKIPWDENGIDLYQIDCGDFIFYKSITGDLFKFSPLYNYIKCCTNISEAVLRTLDKKKTVTDGHDYFKGIWCSVKGALKLAKQYEVYPLLKVIFEEITPCMIQAENICGPVIKQSILINETLVDFLRVTFRDVTIYRRLTDDYFSIRPIYTAGMKFPYRRITTFITNLNSKIYTERGYPSVMQGNYVSRIEAKKAAHHANIYDNIKSLFECREEEALQSVSHPAPNTISSPKKEFIQKNFFSNYRLEALVLDVPDNFTLNIPKDEGSKDLSSNSIISSSQEEDSDRGVSHERPELGLGTTENSEISSNLLSVTLEQNNYNTIINLNTQLTRDEGCQPNISGRGSRIKRRKR